MIPPEAPQPVPARPGRSSTLRLLPIVLAGVPSLVFFGVAGGRFRGASAKRWNPAVQTIGDRENVADQIEVVGSHVDWHPGAMNWHPFAVHPHESDFLWVTAHFRNHSKTPIGVVWADVQVLNQAGQELAGETKEVVFYSEGARKPLAPSAIWKGDKDFPGESYLLALDNQEQSKQPVIVKIKITHAYRNKDTGPEGQALDIGGTEPPQAATPTGG